MKIIETQVFWSEGEKNIVERERLLNLHFLGEKNNLQFYKTSSLDTRYIGGELIINFSKLNIAYSRKINSEFKKNVLYHSQLNYKKDSDNIWEGFIYESEPENNFCELRFIN
jgi:hypothetical protein